MVKIFLASQVLKSPDSVAPPGFCNRGEWGLGVYRGSRVRSPPEADRHIYCSAQGICRVCREIRRSFMTMKAHTYYIIFGRPPIGGKLPHLPPLAAPLSWFVLFWHLSGNLVFKVPTDRSNLHASANALWQRRIASGKSLHASLPAQTGPYYS